MSALSLCSPILTCCNSLPPTSKLKTLSLLFLLVSLSQIAETYAFLPREAVTRFLMSCGECQKRMHISTTGHDYKGAKQTQQKI